MVADTMPEHESEWAAMGRVAQLLGVGTPETVRRWVRRAEIDAGARPGMSSEESVEIRRFKREVAKLRRANAMLKAASVFSRPNWTGPSGDRPIHQREQALSHGRWFETGCRHRAHQTLRALADRGPGRVRHRRVGRLVQPPPLYRYCGDIPPAEFEDAFYAHHTTRRRPS
jgi:transposase